VCSIWIHCNASFYVLIMAAGNVA